METVIFTCKYFKFGSNTTTGLSQSYFRNFLACSIKFVISSTSTRISRRCKDGHEIIGIDSVIGSSFNLFLVQAVQRWEAGQLVKVCPPHPTHNTLMFLN